ncbi:MAG: exosortase A [Erythrobacter sp.]
MSWKQPFAVALLSIAAMFIIAHQEWREMLHQWWNIDTYNHILLVPLIIAWLVWNKRAELAKLNAQGWKPGIALFALAMAVWMIGKASDINLLAHAGAVGALQAAIIAILGPRITMLLLLPIGMMAFLVPFGDEIIPPLQSITAQIAIFLTEVSGVPAVIDGIYIDTPVGLFIVAEACSGVKFLIAMVTLAVLICFTQFESWTRRAIFLAASIIIPILANGVRAWGTIYIAQSQGVEFAAGFDHIFYGWIFFAIVVGVILAGAWRYFEREPEDEGYVAADLSKMDWLNRISRHSASNIAILIGIVLVLMVAGVWAAIVAPVAIG